MTAVAFDTLRFVRTLRDKAKMPQEQAEGLADAVSEAIQGDLATKADVEALRLSSRADIETVRTEITALSHKLDLGLASIRGEGADTRAELKLLEQRMTIKLGGLVAAAIGILIAAIRYLPPAAH